MLCNKCGKDIANDAIFCSYCGQAVKNEKEQNVGELETNFICPNCNKEFDSENVFCDVCGYKLIEKDNCSRQENIKIMTIYDVFYITGRGMVVTGLIENGTIKLNDIVSINNKQYEIGGIEESRKLIESADAGMNVGILFKGAGRNDLKKGDIIYKSDAKKISSPPFVQDTVIQENTMVEEKDNGTVRHSKLYELTMVSKYNGEPTVGVASATGKLSIYSDTIEFEKSLGNAAAMAFGLVGMVAAQNKIKKDGKIEVYQINSIQSVTKGKYMGVMPTLVIRFKDGNIISFSGIARASDIDNSIRIIESCM